MCTTGSARSIVGSLARVPARLSICVFVGGCRIGIAETICVFVGGCRIGIAETVNGSERRLCQTDGRSEFIYKIVGAHDLRPL